jgi:hypothetical protein
LLNFVSILHEVHQNRSLEVIDHLEIWKSWAQPTTVLKLMIELQKHPMVLEIAVAMMEVEIIIIIG